MSRGTSIFYKLYLDGVEYAGSRVHDWGAVRAELSQSDLWSSDVGLSILDTDYNLWATYNPYAVLHSQGTPIGTHPLNLPIEIHSSIDSGDSYQRQWVGRIKSYGYEDGLYRVYAQDKLKDLAENRFLWDYAEGGTIDSWSGSNCYFTAFLGTDVYLPIGGTEGTGGEIIKFSDATVSPGAGTSIGRAIRDNDEYRVSSATWCSGTGTLRISPIPRGIGQSPWIFNRETLAFSGVPSDIIQEMLCSGGTGNIWTPYSSDEYLCKGTSALLQVNMRGTITDDGEGAVTRALFNICKVTMADFYISIDSSPGSSPAGTFVYDVWSPRKLYEESFATYTEGSHILDGFRFSESIDNVFSEVSLSYAYNPELGTHTGNVKREVGIGYNDLSNVKEIQTNWIADRNEAQVLCDRWTAFYKYSSPEIEISLTPDAYSVAQRDGLLITHRAGSLTNRRFEVRGYTKDFQRDKVSIAARDAEIFNSRRGYAWWGKAAGGGTGGLEETVTSTSVSGWGSQAEEPCPLYSSGTGTVFNINVTNHGTVFVWW